MGKFDLDYDFFLELMTLIMMTYKGIRGDDIDYKGSFLSLQPWAKAPSSLLLQYRNGDDDGFKP